MKPGSFNKMPISPRRMEHFKDLGKSTLRRPIFEIVRIHEMSRAPLALQYFANITAVVSSRGCRFINGKKITSQTNMCWHWNSAWEWTKHWCNQGDPLQQIRPLGKSFQVCCHIWAVSKRAQETRGVRVYFAWMKFLTVILSLQVSRVIICISRALALGEPCWALSCLAWSL